MSNETTITIVGNLTADPELRFTSNGAAVASFTIASTPRFYDKDSSQWKDGDSLFLRCSIWRQYAENVAESLTKGMQVIATGRLKQRSYEDREGIKRTVVELDIDDVGPTLRFSTAKVTRATRDAASRAAGQNGGTSVTRSSAGSAPQDDPWAAAASAPAGGYSDQPPF